ncbi:hypothetical protein ABZY19_01460 [Streptomyces sp. NPDC006475]|uniref:hypothetical protein n=1 Tax=Streptomyces sp. NPDC006475 TaxID=3155719 RepID=UPI00339F9CCA
MLGEGLTGTASEIGRAGDTAALIFTSLDHAWAAERIAKGPATLLVQPDPHLGLQPEHLTEVAAWISQLPTTRAA